VEAASLTAEEQALMTAHGLSLEQIGYRRGIRGRMKALSAQEYAEDAETCFLVSGEPFFEMSAVEERLKSAPEPVQRKRNGQLEIWLAPVAGRRYVAAVDPAGGGADGDWSVVEVLDLETGMQCAEFAAHQTGPELAETVRDLGWDYNTAWLVVERNNHGAGLLWLLENKGYREIYRGSDGKLGLLTTSLSRPAMLARLADALLAEPGILMSHKLLAEMRSFVRLRNGSCGARSGTHDDRVMAMALGLAARAEILGTRDSGPGIGLRGVGFAHSFRRDLDMPER
jgi:hypothetical protein